MLQMFTIIKWIFIVYLLGLSVEDICRQKISLFHLAAGIPICMAGCLFRKEGFTVDLVSGGAFGILFLGISRVTKEAFGYGDSILIIVIGCFFGIWNLLTILFAAFTMAAVFSILLLTVGKKSKHTEFPFIPFLASACIGGMISGVC